jgi:exopolysaccharide biosynthesis polyprenyl glycosylphosphotransferase
MSAADSSLSDSLQSRWLTMTPTRSAEPSSAEKFLPVALVKSLWRSTKVMAVSSGRGIALVRRDLLIVGSEATAQGMRGYPGWLSHSGYRFRGIIADGDGPGTDADDIVGQIREIFSVARAMFVDEILFTAQPCEEMLAYLCEQARLHQVNLRYVPNEPGRADAVHRIGKLPTIVAYQKTSRTLSMVCKRLLDITLGGVALVILSPVFAAVALAIALQNDGPVLYRSERVGLRGREFGCYKFRTMLRDADVQRQDLMHLNERSGILFKISKDPRLTPLGAWLRKYSLDELPQLFNVLRGEMSLVGPRPSLRSEVQQYQTAHFRRLDVLPGMTGLWQVEARTDPSFDSYVALDSKYVDEWSLWLDLSLMLRTFRTVFRGTGV